MAQENNISQQLNDLLVTRGYDPELRDASGNDGCEPKDAKLFKIDYTAASGKNYGTMVIILDVGNDLKAMFGNNLGRGMEDQDKNEWFEFQQQLSQFANAHRWTYTGDDISKLKYTMQGLAAIKEGLFEGYYGTRRISYAGEPTEARLMIRHNRNLGENDARFRYVESIFVETADGERYRLPFTNLAGGRAMLEHVRQGGKPYDVRGNHICEMITELKVLARFNRASQGRVLEGIKQGVVEGAQIYYKSLRESIKRLSGPRGYSAYFESWHPADITEQDQLVEDIKTLFVEQTIDNRIEQALPLLAKIQRGREMKEADIFENWMNTLAEGTWNLPETPEQLNKLKELMSSELIVGPDGTNATEQLYDLVGDDLLFDRISELAAQDPRANLWDDSVVQSRMQELGIQMPDNSAPDAMAQPEQSPVAPGMAEADNIGTFESLQRMRHLSGMPLEENVLNDSGSTLDYIITTYQRDIKDFVQNGNMSDHLYDALYDYYFDDMPYGVKKARTGDPYEWIGERFFNDLRGADMVDEAGVRVRKVRSPNIVQVQAIPSADIKSAKLNDDPLPMMDLKSSLMAQGPDISLPRMDLTPSPVAGLDITNDQPLEEGCNYTMENDYCPVHGLKECWLEEMNQSILATGSRLIEDLDEGGMPGMSAALRGAGEMGGQAVNAVKGMIAKIPPGHPDYPLLQAARNQEQGNMKVWNKRYPDTPWTSQSDTDLLKSFNHDQNVQKGFGQFQRDAMPNDYSPTGYTRAQKSKGAAIDAQNSMQGNQDLFKRAYGIDEDMTDVGDVVGQAARSVTNRLGQAASDIYEPIGNFVKGVKQGWHGPAQTTPQTAAAVAMPVRSPDIIAYDLPSPDTSVIDPDLDEADMMNPEIPSDFGSPEHLAHLAGLGKALQAGDRSALGKSNAALAAAQVGQGRTPWEPAPTPSLSTPGAAHDGQQGYDYQDEVPDQSDAETARLNRSGTPDTPNDRKMNDADWIMSQNPEEPKGRAHSGQSGYNYSDELEKLKGQAHLGQDGYNYQDEEPDQSDAETSRLGRAGRSINYESREGDALLARIKSLALIR